MPSDGILKRILLRDNRKRPFPYRLGELRSTASQDCISYRCKLPRRPCLGHAVVVGRSKPRQQEAVRVLRMMRRTERRQAQAGGAADRPGTEQLRRVSDASIRPEVRPACSLTAGMGEGNDDDHPSDLLRTARDAAKRDGLGRVLRIRLQTAAMGQLRQRLM